MLSALGLLSEAERTEYWACLALRYTPHLGARSIHRLLAHFGSALSAVRNTARWPEAAVGAHRAAGFLDDSWREAAKSEWQAAKKLSGRIVLWMDPAYPSLLRELPDAPALLYALGDPGLLAGPGLAVVGKRQCSSEGIRAAAYFAESLAEAGVTIVSGLARGVDQAAHRAALNKPGRTVAVLGTGVDVVYPRESASLYNAISEQGLLISEFAPGTPPSPGNFPIRNRIISGLSLGVLVAEASPRSGSLITARLALEQNRSVFAVPGSLGAAKSQGCQELIRQGAKPVFAASDVIEDILPHLRTALKAMPPAPAIEESATQDLPKSDSVHRSKPLPAPARETPAFPDNSPEAKALALLAEGQAVSVDLLDDALELPAGEFNALLLRLEVRGLIRKLPGHYYTLTEGRHV